MHQKLNERVFDLNPQETSEWEEALSQVIDEAGPDRAAYLLDRLGECARANGADLPIHLNTPYTNTIRPEDEVAYPGDRAMERRIKSLIRWNAMAMVVRQNKYDAGIGGHISTYSSLATLLEVGFNHFFRASYGDQPGDLVYFQGHASPGVYARAFLEGRLSEEHLKNFRHELEGRFLGSRFSNAHGRRAVRAAHLWGTVRRCVRASDGPCIRRVRLRRVRVQWALG